MAYIAAFIGVVGFIGSVLTIWQFVDSKIGNSPKRSQKLALVFGVGTLILIVLSLLTAGTIAPSVNRPPNNPQPGTTVTTAPSTPSSTPIANTTTTVSSATPTPPPTVAGSPITLPHTFTGNGNQTTPTFQAGQPWSMAISCSAPGPLGSNQFMIAVIDTSTGMTINNGPISVPACGSSGTIQTLNEQQSGIFYLQVTATTDITWTIQLQ